jgi:hypothetical protein
MLTTAATASPRQTHVLEAKDFRHYIERFNEQDREMYLDVVPDTTMIPNAEAWHFLSNNVPLFDCPDAAMEEIYYFRWWTYRKHIKRTPEGYVITEFMPAVSWSGKYNTISCPAGHHFYEGRWLADPVYLRDYARFWLGGGGSPRRYSFWIGDALWAFHKVHPSGEMLTELLPALVDNYQAWERGHRQPDGLFWQLDDRDGMEAGIGGHGKRPTINSYMYGDARAIAAIARLDDQDTLAKRFTADAQRLRRRVLDKLWSPKAKFFKTLACKNRAKAPRYGGREPKQPAGDLVNVRELIGYVPWYFHLPPTNDARYAVAWKQLLDPEGFRAPFGPTTAEQRHPQFAVSYKGHECQWNGPSWPFATTQTLTAMANLLHDYRQDVIDRNAYFNLLKTYTQSHRFRAIAPADHEQGASDDNAIAVRRDRPWIDENLNPYNGDWLARTKLHLQAGRADPLPRVRRPERGKAYNHSAYGDLIISGLVGLRPQADDTLVVDPLLPRGEWDYFCLDGVRYHGRDITIRWDRTGEHYGQGSGLTVLVDGRRGAQRAALGRLVVDLTSRER